MLNFTCVVIGNVEFDLNLILLSICGKILNVNV